LVGDFRTFLQICAHQPNLFRRPPFRVATAGKNDVPHDAVGPFDRRLGDAEQQPGLARDAAKVRQKLLLDPALSGGVDPLDGLDEGVDQVVRQLTGRRAAQTASSVDRTGSGCRRNS